MRLDSNVELLGCVPIFQGLTPEQLSAIARKAKKSFHQKGEYIIEAGQEGEAAYVILSGCAVCPAGGDHAADLGPGTLLGELVMLVETSYGATVTVKERVRALAIRRSALYELMEADSAIARHFSEKLMQRLLNLAGELRQVDAQFAAIEASMGAAV